ncbi:MAG: hypothetical protein WAM88_00105 [Nitrososphaeraceae archaeon]|jgi:hypothetical protein
MFSNDIVVIEESMTATMFSGMLLSFPPREDDLSHTSILYYCKISAFQNITIVNYV